MKFLTSFLRSSFDCTARLWDALTGACLKIFDTSLRAVFTLNFSPTGKFLVTGSGDGNLNVYLVKVRVALLRFKDSSELCACTDVRESLELERRRHRVRYL